MYSKMFSKTASNPATFTIKKTTSHYTYSHQKYWIVDDKSVGLSTGNMSPSDFNNQTASTDKVRSFPPFGVPGWTRLNRDLTICTESFPYCLPVPLHFRPQYSFAYHSLTICFTSPLLFFWKPVQSKCSPSSRPTPRVANPEQFLNMSYNILE